MLQAAYINLFYLIKMNEEYKVLGKSKNSRLLEAKHLFGISILKWRRAYSSLQNVNCNWSHKKFRVCLKYLKVFSVLNEKNTTPALELMLD